LVNSPPNASAPVNSLSGARGFIFDIDGTLYDSRYIHRRLFFARPLDVGLLLADRKTRKSLTGADYREAEAYYREFFSRMALRIHKPASALHAWYFDAYMPRMYRVLKKYYRLRPGCVELFEELTRSPRTGGPFKFAIYSDYPQTAERLQALGLSVDTGLLFGPENFGAQKPAVRPFLSIAEALGVPPGEILVVGDREDADGAGAIAAGMDFIRIKTSKKRQGNSPALEWEEFCSALREHLRQHIRS
jgi:HAD superfamily hydrolase (TIGR01549 family)